jgi:hypothetical protein
MLLGALKVNYKRGNTMSQNNKWYVLFLSNKKRIVHEFNSEYAARKYGRAFRHDYDDSYYKVTQNPELKFKSSNLNGLTESWERYDK